MRMNTKKRLVLIESTSFSFIKYVSLFFRPQVIEPFVSFKPDRVKRKGRINNTFRILILINFSYFTFINNNLHIRTFGLIHTCNIFSIKKIIKYFTITLDIYLEQFIIFEMTGE